LFCFIDSFKATAIGKNDTIVQNFLAENYHTVSTVNGALYLAGRVLREFQLKLIPDGDLNLVEIVTITHDPKTERGIICQSLNPTQTLELWSRSK
jgi:20S proteasome alpha/beta subunit